MKGIFSFLFVILVLVSVAIASEDNRVIVTIPSQVAVKNETFALSDIANIVYNQPEQSEFAYTLGAINLGKSPARYDAKDLKGEAVLEAIERLGVSRETIGYHIPTHITITRQIIAEELSEQPLKSNEPTVNKKIPPLVVKGQPINVVYKSGLLTVNLSGVAMSSANESETLMVKNVRSNKIIRARVISSEQAEVITE